jgi:hypothetical protein
MGYFPSLFRAKLVQEWMMRCGRLFICLIIISAQVFGQDQSTRYEDLKRQFDYERKAPLDVRELSRENLGGG